VIGALKRLFTGSNVSKAVAKSRLHFVLVQDRTGLTNEEMGKFKEELIGVIERYFVIDQSAFDIDYKRENDSTTLFINSPIIVRRQESVNGETGAKRKLKAAVEQLAANNSGTKI
jgi:cell division topological specificity factor